MTKPYTIEREPSGEYELICKPGFSIDGQHFAIEDTHRDALRTAKDIRPCNCPDCQRQLSNEQRANARKIIAETVGAAAYELSNDQIDRLLAIAGMPDAERKALLS